MADLRCGGPLQWRPFPVSLQTVKVEEATRMLIQAFHVGDEQSGNKMLQRSERSIEWGNANCCLICLVGSSIWLTTTSP